MKLLVLLAVLGAAAAQYKVYSGVPTPFHAGYTAGYAGYPHAGYAAHPTANAGYAAHPTAYAGYPTAYAGYPAGYAGYPTAYAAHPYGYGLPLSFKPAEEKKAAEATPAVESRTKRSADEDQKADESHHVPTYAANTYPLTYTAGYPYNAYPAAAAYRPSVYSAAYGSAYSPLAYHGCVYGAHGCGLYNGVYNNYASPVVHSLKKRDTAAAEDDQQADESHHVSAYAAHPYSLGYTAGYPYTPYNAGYNVPSVYNAGYNVPSVYNAGYNVPSVYSAGHAVPYSGFSNNHAYSYRTFY